MKRKGTGGKCALQSPSHLRMSALLLGLSCAPHPPRQLKVRVEALLETSLESRRPASSDALLAKGTRPGQIRSQVVWAKDRVGTLTPGHSREGWGPASLLLALTWKPVAQGKKSKHTNHGHPSGMAAIVYPEGAGANPVGSNSTAPSCPCCWPLPPPSPCPGSRLCLDHS